MHGESETWPCECHEIVSKRKQTFWYAKSGRTKLYMDDITTIFKLRLLFECGQRATWVWRKCGFYFILANRPDLVGTVPIWRPKPDVPPDDPKEPIRPDLSRSTPKNTILNLPFACSLCSSVRIQVFSVSFGFFHVPVRGGQLSKQNICIYWPLFWLKSSFSCHFPLNARNFVYILGLFFIAVIDHLHNYCLG